ncbi:MAG: hypothetical protein ACXVDN_24640, partial [Ktedonobacteraceae bacterium]
MLSKVLVGIITLAGYNSIFIGMMIMNIHDLQRLYYIPRRVSLLARRNLKRQGFSKVFFIQNCSQAGLLYESVKRVLGGRGG